MILFTRSNQLSPFTREIMDAHAAGKLVFIIERQTEAGWEEAGRVPATSTEEALKLAYVQLACPTEEIRVLGISAVGAK